MRLNIPLLWHASGYNYRYGLEAEVEVELGIIRDHQIRIF